MFLCVPEFVKTVFPTDSLTTSTGTLLASFGLCYTLTASIDILKDLKHRKASIDTLTAFKEVLRREIQGLKV
jgi:hypothetical protein